MVKSIAADGITAVRETGSGTVNSVGLDNRPIWEAVTYLNGTETDAEGQFTVDSNITLNNLGDGIYQIEEIKAPTGYVITDSAPVTFTVADGAITSIDGTNTAVVTYTAAIPESKDQTTGEITTSAQDAIFTVGNTPGAALPNTGGTGTTLFYLIGVVMTLGAGLLLVQKRKMAS